MQQAFPIIYFEVYISMYVHWKMSKWYSNILIIVLRKIPSFFLFVFVFFFPRYFRRFYFSFFFRLQPLRVFGCLVFSGRDRSIGGSTRYVVSCVCACVPRTHYLVHTTGMRQGIAFSKLGTLTWTAIGAVYEYYCGKGNGVAHIYQTFRLLTQTSNGVCVLGPW